MTMIGGTDIVFRVTGDPSALDTCVRVVRRHWPEACFEDAVTGAVYDDYGEIPFGQVRQLFAYPDAEAQAASDAPLNCVLYFLACEEGITVVVDDAEAAGLRPILDSLRATLPSLVRQGFLRPIIHPSVQA